MAYHLQALFSKAYEGTMNDIRHSKKETLKICTFDSGFGGFFTAKEIEKKHKRS